LLVFLQKITILNFTTKIFLDKPDGLSIQNFKKDPLSWSTLVYSHREPWGDRFEYSSKKKYHPK